MAENTKPHKDKLNNESYALGMSKHIPTRAANLAYVSSPEITEESVSIIPNELNIVQDETPRIYYSNVDGGCVLEDSKGDSLTPYQDILVTDEFSIKKDINDVPEPLFYKATLKRKIDGTSFATNTKIVPYQYGYILKTEEMIKAANTSSDKSNVTPLIYAETYKTGYNNLFSITSEDDARVTSGFKFRMVQEDGNKYRVDVYNNFDPNKIYHITYRDYTGSQITETLDSSTLFNKIGYDDFTTKLLDPEYLMATEYAIKQEGKMYKVYSAAQMMAINDSNRKPFEFKYRVLANLTDRFSKSNPSVLNVGILYLNQNVSEDTHSLLVDFVAQVGRMFPEYVSFQNPHPPVKYDIPRIDANLPYIEQYKKSPDYWDVDLTAPQSYINDYDIIFITGYGSHDISIFNGKLSKYLSTGGKLVIDNLSNEATEILAISLGATPVVNYTMAAPALTGTKIFGTLSGYKSRYHQLNDTMAGNIAYTYDDNGTPVTIGPSITLVDEDSSEWEDIIRLNSGSRSIAVKTYGGKGKIVLSNCGILRAFCNGSDDAKRFVVNMVLILGEDLWESTPWIYDRVYHKNQLYKHEYDLEGYITDINPIAVDTQIIAKKIIADRVKDHVSYYTGTYGLEGSYHVEAYEKDNDGDFIPLTSVYMPTTLGGNMPLYAFARNTNNTSFDVTSVEGYEESNIHVYPSSVSFKVAITPFTFRWIVKDGSLVQEMLEADIDNRSKIEYTIDRSRGFTNLDLLSVVVPQLPKGKEWADKSKIFFRVEISGYTELDGKFINPYENRINLYIYDKFTGMRIYTSDGDNIISYSDLYGMRSIQKSSGTVNRAKYLDIILQASTNYYTLAASKRTFAIRNNVAKGQVLMIPTGLNTNESWFPRIRRMTFIKNSFDKEDYDRISKTIGFRYDKSYILQKATEYFGANPDDDLVADVIARLNNNEVVDIEDKAVLAEAFDLINEQNSYEYDVVEYRRQVWDDAEPYKHINDEFAKYVNKNTIQVQYTPLHIDNGTENGEILQGLTPRIYKAQNKNWLISRDIIIQQQVGEAWETIEEDNIDSPFVVDYANGLIIFDSDQTKTFRATYTHTNLSVVRKTYSGTMASNEELDELIGNLIYAPKNMCNKRILRVPNPRVMVRDTAGSTILLPSESYTIDYDTGLVTMLNKVTGTVLMDYSYSNVEYIEVTDYDSKNGLLRLSQNIHFNDNIYVSYYYAENYYEYRGYYDKDLMRYMYVDLNPTRGHECTYPVVNSSGSLEYQETPTYKLLGKTLYIYMLPYRIIRQSGESTTEETTIRHTWDKNELTLLQVAHPELIVIGSIKLMNNYSVYDVITLDTRKRGGGLKEDLTDDQIERFDELSLNMWDISPFDGRSYHPNGITVIKLPKTILAENGGRFSDEEVKAIVENHLALGVMPIIKYY